MQLARQRRGGAGHGDGEGHRRAAGRPLARRCSRPSRPRSTSTTNTAGIPRRARASARTSCGSRTRKTIAIRRRSSARSTATATRQLSTCSAARSARRSPIDDEDAFNAAVEAIADEPVADDHLRRARRRVPRVADHARALRARDRAARRHPRQEGEEIALEVPYARMTEDTVQEDPRDRRGARRARSR